MNSSWLTRLQTVFLFALAQTAIPLFTFALLVILAIYLINFLFIESDKVGYITSVYLEVLITLFLTVLFGYISFINIILNLLKFGKVKLAGFLIEKTRLITPETKLYYYNLIGETSKALEIAKALDVPEKLNTPFRSKHERYNTTKVFIADAYLRSKKYKKAQILLETILSPSEADYVYSRKAQIVLLKDNNNTKAIEMALEAIEMNKSGMVRNADSKLFELNLILAEIYLLSNKDEEAFNILNPWLDGINKHPIYFYCRFNKYFVSWYYLLLAKVIVKRGDSKEEITDYLKKSIQVFKESIYAKEARELLKELT